MKYLVSALALSFALVTAGPVAAGGTAYHQGNTTYEGKGELKASGFGNATVSGFATVRGDGVGVVKAPAGIKYRSSKSGTLWKTTDGKDLEGLGWIVLKLAGQEVRFEGIATVQGRSRWGGQAKAQLEGSGTVTTRGGVECQVNCGRR